MKNVKKKYVCVYEYECMKKISIKTFYVAENA